LEQGSMTFPLVDAGSWDEALETAYEIVRWEREAGASQLGLMAGNVMGWVQTQRGDVDEAAEISAAVLPRAREAEDPQMLWTMLGIAGKVALARGERAPGCETPGRAFGGGRT
jgi:hypothetical protein